MIRKTSTNRKFQVPCSTQLFHNAPTEMFNRQTCVIEHWQDMKLPYPHNQSIMTDPIDPLIERVSTAGERVRGRRWGRPRRFRLNHYLKLTYLYFAVLSFKINQWEKYGMIVENLQVVFQFHDHHKTREKIQIDSRFAISQKCASHTSVSRPL